MKSFQATELRTGSGSVYREVEAVGAAEIVHRDRPKMLLMTKDRLLEILASKSLSEAYAAELQA